MTARSAVDGNCPGCGGGGGSAAFEAEIQVLCDPQQYCGTPTDGTGPGVTVDVALFGTFGVFPLGTLAAPDLATLAANIQAADPFGGVWTVVGTQICVTPTGGNGYTDLDLGNWSSASPDETVPLTGSGLVPFLQVCTIDTATGMVTVCNSFELDGTTPYVPSGSPELCTSGGGSGGSGLTAQVELLGDFQAPFADNVVTPFQRVKVLDTATGQVMSVADFDMAAAPYVTTGTPAPLDMSNEFGQSILCDSNGPFIALMRRNPTTGLLVATYRDLTGAFYTPSGTIRDCTSGGIPANVDGIQLANATETTVSNGGNIPDVVRTITVSVTRDTIGGGAPVQVDITMPFSGNTISLFAGNSRTFGNGDGAGLLRLESGASFTVSVPNGAEADVVWELP